MKLPVLAQTLAALGSATILHAGAQSAPQRFDLIEATVPQILAAQPSRLVSARQRVDMYLARIAAVDAPAPRSTAA